MGATWTIPIFCVFYLIAPWLLRKAKSFCSVVFVWFSIFVVTKLLCVVYSCPVFENIHLLFLGCVLFVSVEKQTHAQTEICLIIMIVFSMILKKYEFAYALILALLMLVFVTMDSLTLPKKIQQIIDCLDKYTYTVYLMHCTVFCSLLDRLKALSVSPVIIGVLAIVGTVLSTWIVGKYLEKPIQRLLKKRLIGS